LARAGIGSAAAALLVYDDLPGKDLSDWGDAELEKLYTLARKAAACGERKIAGRGKALKTAVRRTGRNRRTSLFASLKR